MKFSMFCGQPKSILEQADEIYLRDSDTNNIVELVKDYSDKDFVVIVNKYTTNLDFNTFKACQERITGTIYCALENIYDYKKCQEYGLKYFYIYPVTSFFELKGLQEIGVSYVRLGMPLFFQMSQVMTFGIPLRITPNKAYEAYIPRKDGICGQWVRPEDLPLYEDYSTSEILCEFRPFQTFERTDEESSPLVYERLLFDVYKNRKSWDGRLKYLIQDIGVENFNSTIDEDFGKHRLNCGQTCQLNRCHYCYQAIKYDEIALKYKENKLEKENSN